jgi:hypothetical protein
LCDGNKIGKKEHINSSYSKEGKQQSECCPYDVSRKHNNTCRTKCNHCKDVKNYCVEIHEIKLKVKSQKSQVSKEHSISLPVIPVSAVDVPLEPQLLPLLQLRSLLSLRLTPHRISLIVLLQQ